MPVVQPRSVPAPFKKLKSKKKQVFSVTRSQEAFTTVMIQGIPWTYQESDILYLLQEEIGPASFDFFYMPWNLQHDNNNGCAFVNFVTPEDAQKCVTMWNGCTFPCCGKVIKPCTVVPANLQGYAANLEYYRRRLVGASNHPHPPLVFQDGVCLEFRKVIKTCSMYIKAMKNAAQDQCSLVAESKTECIQDHCSTHSGESVEDTASTIESLSRVEELSSATSTHSGESGECAESLARALEDEQRPTECSRTKDSRTMSIVELNVVNVGRCEVKVRNTFIDDFDDGRERIENPCIRRVRSCPDLAICHL